jgi:hypothetical protein
MVKSVKVERFKDCEELVRVLSRSEACPATNKDIIRPLNYELFIGSHLPEPDWHRLGALVVTLFRSFAAVDVEIWLTDVGIWVADALVDFGDRRRLRKGEGDTPLQAVIELVYDIQRY